MMEILKRIENLRNQKAIEEYIRNQEREDMIADQISFKEYNDPFKGSK